MESSPQSVVGLPALARWIADGDFGNPRSRPGGQSWDEPMELTVERKVLNGLSPISFEGRAKIVHRNTGKLCHHPVRNPAGQPTGKPGVLPLGPPPADDVVALFKLCDEGRNFFRRML